MRKLSLAIIAAAVSIPAVPAAAQQASPAPVSTETSGPILPRCCGFPPSRISQNIAVQNRRTRRLNQNGVYRDVRLIEGQAHAAGAPVIVPLKSAQNICTQFRTAAFRRSADTVLSGSLAMLFINPLQAIGALGSLGEPADEQDARIRDRCRDIMRQKGVDTVRLY